MNSSPFHFQAIVGLLTFSVFCYFISRLVRKSHTSDESTAPPEAVGAWPIVGHLPVLLTSNPLCRTLGSMADKYGPIFTVLFGLQRTLVVSNWEMAKECFTTNDRALANRPASAAGKYMTYNYAVFIFSPYGPYLQEMRKLATVELLSKKRLDSLKHVPYSEIDMFIKRLYQETNKGDNTVDMNQWFGDMVMNTVLRMVVGKRYFYVENITEQETKEMHILHETVTDFFKLAGVSVASDDLPFLSWLDLDGKKRAMKKTAKAMDLITQNWLDEHRKNRLSSTNRSKGEQDFMDVLLATVGNNNAHLHDYEVDTVIKATTITMILAGIESSSITLSWALSLLLNHPNILAKAQEELDTNVGRNRMVEELDIDNLAYLQAIIKETLRMYPPGPLAIPHEAIEDCQVGGYQVQKGTRVLVNLWKLHRDPNMWSNPLVFQPERFIEGKANIDYKGQNFEYIPFGSGRRMCPASLFSLQTLHMALARILQAFELTTPSNEPVDMTEGLGLSMPKTTPLLVRLKPRLSPELYI